MNQTSTLTGQCVAEFLGTGLLIFFGAGCVAALRVAGASFGQWEISIIWGLGVAMAIYLTAVKTGGSAAHDMLTLFKIEKQLAIEPIHQRGGAEGPGRLGNNKRQHLAAFKTGEQPQGNGHRRI